MTIIAVSNLKELTTEIDDIQETILDFIEKNKDNKKVLQDLSWAIQCSNETINDTLNPLI